MTEPPYTPKKIKPPWLLGLFVLTLPYLPVLPDVFPALQLLAGPVRGVVWLVVVAPLALVLGVGVALRQQGASRRQASDDR